MSNLDPSSNQLQLSDEDEEEDQDQGHDLEPDEDQEDNGLRSSRSFQPSAQPPCGSINEKPVVDSYQQKWPTLVASCTPLASKQQCIGYSKIRDRVQGGFGKEVPKMRMKRTKGEKEEEEGNLVCSTGSKDKHTKVCTSKGLRDRRVRLSANTAIDFYDVQDRLGFDRPSKAIDWLLKKAKVAIDALGNESKIAQFAYQEFEGSQIHHQTQQESKFPNPEYDIQNQQNMNDNAINNFSFISMVCGSASSNSIDFHNNQHDLNPRIRSQTQDLCLSLQSLQEDPTLLQQHLSPYPFGEHQLSRFTGSAPINMNTTSNTGWFQKMITQNSNPKGCVIDSSERHLEPILDQNQLINQREPLQSTFLPSIRVSSTKTQLSNIDYHMMPAFNSSSATSTGLAYTEISVSPQIQGQEVAGNPTSNRLSSVNSFLHYED